MKKIEAIIQPFKFEDVKDALQSIGIDGMTVTEVRSRERRAGLVPKVKIEMAVSSARCEEVVRTIAAAARTGKIGDGKIFLFDLGEAIRIRNDERGDAAL